MAYKVYHYQKSELMWEEDFEDDEELFGMALCFNGLNDLMLAREYGWEKEKEHLLRIGIKGLIEGTTLVARHNPLEDDVGRYAEAIVAYRELKEKQDEKDY